MFENLLIDSVINEISRDFTIAYYFAFFGLGLMILEAIVGGILQDNLLVLGLSSLVTGVLGILFSIESLLILTVLLGFWGIIIYYILENYSFFGERGEQTSVADSLKGEVGIATNDIDRYNGQVKLNNDGFDPHYFARSINGEKIQEGAKIEVVDPRGGNVLKVKKIQD
jgi:membrane protein implicated in regulation of membrane protease activity